MEEMDKHIAVLFDEMAIMPSFQCNKHNRCIDGFEYMGDDRDVYIADHVLVFMVRGLRKPWKSPISYNFSAENSAIINTLLEDKEAEYLRQRNGNQYRRNSFEIEGCTIYPLYDPPHLLKGVRNN
uniref:Uncharacterized protein LOC114344400 n=1 Tax=Diabrotica virgifera virgifera TaxID=50390 RepID=A0A6P7H4V3_DIAVI